MSALATREARLRDLRQAIAEVPFWYHTMELGPGIVTPGYWDLRTMVGRLPWPDVRGKRCLDIGTADGFLAFELERRGASEVLAIDVPDPSRWDWPPDARDWAPERMLEFRAAGNPGFRIACEALGSSVEYREMTVYELSPESVGIFDVVVCGSVLLNLRDPLRALELIRDVCDGELLSTEAITVALTVLHPRRPVAELEGSGGGSRWWRPNAAGHRQMLFAAGFEIERTIRPYLLPLGEQHRQDSSLRSMMRRVSPSGFGVPHSAALARRRV